MEQTLKARILAAVITLAMFVIAATEDQLLNLEAGMGIAVVASVSIWLQPKTDFGNWRKLTDHLLLSLPIAGLAIVAGLVVYSPETGFDMAKAVGIFVLVFVPANVLEQKLLNSEPPPA